MINVEKQFLEGHETWLNQVFDWSNLTYSGEEFHKKTKDIIMFFMWGKLLAPFIVYGPYSMVNEQRFFFAGNLEGIYLSKIEILDFFKYTIRN